MTAQHWDAVYGSKLATDLSWHAESLDKSFDLITKYSTESDRVIDVGGGISPLPAQLINRGYRCVAVADISHAALERAAAQLGDRASAVEWICADVASPDSDFGAATVWHDRAVFHFLVDP